MAINRGNHTIRHLVRVTLGSFLLFPVWWYGRGLVKMLRKARQFLANRAADFGLRYWLKNLFRPMYGVRDWQGRLISFFMRVVAIAWYSLLLAVLAVLTVVAVLSYLLIVPLVFFMIWYQLNGLSGGFAQ
jgi:hypothetical protein